jgi:hypothetical protein
VNVAGIDNALIGMALFDMWDAAIKKTHKANGSPLVEAAVEMFEAYTLSAQMGMGMQIAGAAMYGLNAGGNSAVGITAQDIAPFLALNLMA